MSVPKHIRTIKSILVFSFFFFLRVAAALNVNRSDFSAVCKRIRYLYMRSVERIQRYCAWQSDLGILSNVELLLFGSWSAFHNYIDSIKYTYNICRRRSGANTSPPILLRRTRGNAF